jgi:tetratricopeptide (TPR) repeat protein
VKPIAAGLMEGLDKVAWAELEHAYGSAADVPDLLRRLLDADPKARIVALDALYGNVFHQGTRYPATPYVVPFLIDLCGSAEVPRRGDLLRFWGSLIAGYFSVRERPTWGDGERVYVGGEAQVPDDDDDGFAEELHQIYRASVRGHELARALLASDEAAVRAGAAYVLACMPTMAWAAVPALERALRSEPDGVLRAALAFALGELGAADPLRRLLAEDPAPSARCMAACQLARLDRNAELVGPLLDFVARPIDSYQEIPGAGGASTGDAAISIAHLPAEAQRAAVPAICDRLDQARSFDTMPLVEALMSAAFPERDQLYSDPAELSDLQREVLGRMVKTEELWSIGNLSWRMRARGVPQDRARCAALVGATVTDDPAQRSLRAGLAFSRIGFLDKAREHILEALARDPDVVERAPSPHECWLLCAKAFAEADPERAMAAYLRAVALDPGAARRVQPTWPLARLLASRGLR